MSKIDKSLNFLKPIIVKNLFRLGRKGDGGYVVDKDVIKKSDTLLSFGLGSDWSFETDYLLNNKNGKVYVYDHTVNIYTYLRPFLKCLKRFLTLRKTLKDLKLKFNELNKYINLIKNKKIVFKKKKVVSLITKENKETNVKKALDNIGNYKTIMLKIDIEGDEYKLIDEINQYSTAVDTLIMEFHNIDDNLNDFTKAIKELLKNFDIIHIHGNNHCTKNLLGLPTVLELSFNNKRFRPQEIAYKNEFPLIELDFPNNPYKKDLKLSFED